MYIVNLQFLHHQQSVFDEELVQYIVKLQLSTIYAQKRMKEDIQGKAETQKKTICNNYNCIR